MRLSQKHIFLLISAALVIATLVAYEPIRHNDFVTYDDYSYIVDNPLVTSGLTLQSLANAFTQPHFFMWHPLTTISHILDYQIFDLEPSGHHFISVVIHIINALLLFWIIRNLSGTLWLSAFVAGVFALHPIQVESVAWAAERKTVLSGLFWLLTMAAYIHYAKQPRPGRYLLVLLVFGLCIMTKPVVVTLPFALLLLDYWPLERVRWGPVARAAEANGKTAGWLIIEKIPLLGLSAFLSVMTFIMQRQGGVVPTLARMPLEYRAANMFLAYIRYIGKVIWPSGLAVCYPYPHAVMTDVPVILCAVLFVILTVFFIYTGRRRKYAAVGWLWFVGALVPVIGLIQSGAQGMANRYMYIPLVGILIIIGWGVKDYTNKRPQAKIAAAIFGVIVLSSFLVLTRMQVKHWQNTFTLFDYALKVTKDNPVAENIYGSTLFAQGRREEAEIHLRNAARLAPAFVSAIDGLAKVYLTEGRYDEAIANLYEIVRHGEGTAEIYYNLAAALEMQGKYDDAIKYYARSLELDSKDPAANKRIGIALLAAGRTSEAMWYAQRACELTGYKDAECLETLASAFAAAGRFEEAKTTAMKALSIAKSSGKEDLAGDIENHIKLYEAGQPHSQK